MTPEHAAEQLLALGPLHPQAFRSITGWPPDKIAQTLSSLEEAGVVTVKVGGIGAVNSNGRVIWLTRQLPQEQRAEEPARQRPTTMWDQLVA